MRKILFVLFFPLLMACEFKAEKVLSEVRNGNGSELYLISNITKNRGERHEILFEFVKDNSPDFCCLDSTVTFYAISFYRNTACTRGYIEGYKKSRDNLRDIESIDERCEIDYLGSFVYKRYKVNHNDWILSYPKEFCDTIDCE